MRITRKTIIGGGAIIAFVGQDGCGKSTITSDLEKWLRWKIDAQRFYLGSGEHFKTWQKKAIIIIQKWKHNKLGKALSGFLSVSLCLKVAKKAYKEVLKAERLSIMGGISLLDRFPQIQFKKIYDGPKIRSIYLNKTENKIMRIIVKIFAKREETYLTKIQEHCPGLIFKLKLPVSESMARKPENKLEIIERKHYITEHIVFHNSEVIDIDATVNTAKNC